MQQQFGNSNVDPRSMTIQQLQQLQQQQQAILAQQNMAAANSSFGNLSNASIGNLRNLSALSNADNFSANQLQNASFIAGAQNGLANNLQNASFSNISLNGLGTSNALLNNNTTQNQRFNVAQAQQQGGQAIQGLVNNNNQSNGMQNNTSNNLNATLQNNIMMQAMIMQQINQNGPNAQLLQQLHQLQNQQLQYVQQLQLQNVQRQQQTNQQQDLLNTLQGNNKNTSGMGQQQNSDQQFLQQKTLIQQLEQELQQRESKIKNNSDAKPSSSGSTNLDVNDSFKQQQQQQVNSLDNLQQGVNNQQGQSLQNAQMRIQNQLQMNALMQNNLVNSINNKNLSNLSNSATNPTRPNTSASTQSNQSQPGMMNSFIGQNNVSSNSDVNPQLAALQQLQQQIKMPDSSVSDANNNDPQVSANNLNGDTVNQHPQQVLSAGGNNNGNMNANAMPVSSSSAEISTNNDDGNSTGINPWDWQSNLDVAKRKKVLFGLVKLIETSNKESGQSQNPEKLIMMAKRLEEFFYRSAKSTEEYSDVATLKDRLENIARVSTTQGDGSSTDTPNDTNEVSNVSDTAQRKIALLKGQRNGGAMDAFNSMTSQTKDHQEIQKQLVQLLKNQQSKNGDKSKNGSESNGAIMQLKSNLEKVKKKQNEFSQSKYEMLPFDGEDKKKVIRQQQQRLMLLRHSSKCRKGVACTVKFCQEMVNLWNHMRACRDKDCTTEHCLSSRCVLNHYRICKEEGRTSACEVCAPVVKAINFQNSQNGSFGSNDNEEDPLIQFSKELPLQTESKVESSLGKRRNQKDLTYEELLVEQQKLDQQKMFLERLQAQQKLQLRQHQLSNISADSEQGQKLQKQQLLLQKIQKQFLEDQRLLHDLLARHTKKNEMEGSKEKESNNKILPIQSVSLQNCKDNPFSLNENGGPEGRIEPFDLNMNGPDDGHGLQRKRSLSDLSTNSDEGNTFTKQQKLEGSFGQASMRNAEFGGIEASKKDNDNPKKEGNNALISKSMLPLVTQVINHEFAWVFKDPVDPIELGLPDYFEVIENPMDLNLVKTQLENFQYENFEDVRRDVNLVFENAILYNGDDSDVGIMANKMLDKFREGYNKVLNLDKNFTAYHQNLAQV